MGNIRLGAIPVILSDNILLPGKQILWREAAIFLPETESALISLPVQLEPIPSDQLRLYAMQQAGQKLWQDYGLLGFIDDL